MKRLLALLALGLAASACADAEAPLAPTAAAPRLALWGVDNDGDYIDDGLEMELAQRFAPVLYMPNLLERWQSPFGNEGDWTWPATVDWYLANSKLRFHHHLCSDHEPLHYGQVTPSSLVSQMHQGTSVLFGCSHSGDWYSSGGGTYDGGQRYFLTPQDPATVHPGIRDPGQWKTYFHVYRNNFQGLSIQYWFFYAYNDFHSNFNHEGDWEHINVRLDSNHQPTLLWYAQHNDVKQYQPSQVFWYGSTHPLVWVADGSHASYAAENECDGAMVEGNPSNCWSFSSQRWFTWGDPGTGEPGYRSAGLVNMGEAPTPGTSRRPMPGQEWVRYLGMWGELGNGFVDGKTNGPKTPAYQDNWKRDAYVASGSGGAECYSGEIFVRDPGC